MYKSIYKQIKKYENIVIARHIKVDPDAMASQTALKKTIELTFPNKKVYEIGTGTVRFNYIGHMDKLPEDISDCLLISVDTPDLKRLDIGDFNKVISYVESNYDSDCIYDKKVYYMNDIIYLYDRFPFIDYIKDITYDSNNQIIQIGTISKEEIIDYIKTNNIKIGMFDEKKSICPLLY